MKALFDELFSSLSEASSAPFRPFTGPCRDWSDQARNLSDEDLEAALAAQKAEQQP